MPATEVETKRIETHAASAVKAVLQRMVAFFHGGAARRPLAADGKAAGEAVADPHSIRLDDAGWQAFHDVLDHRPVQKKPRLAKLLAEKSALE